MRHEGLPLLKMLAKSDLLVRDTNTDILTDLDILKAFDLPLIKDDDIFEGSVVARMLKERDKRPTRDTWSKFMKTATDCGLGAQDAGELYFHYLDKQNPLIPHDEVEPNIGGSSIDGLGLSADGGGEGEEKCD